MLTKVFRDPFEPSGNISNLITFSIYGLVTAVIKTPSCRKLEIGPYGEIALDGIHPSCCPKKVQEEGADCKEYPISNAESGDYCITINATLEKKLAYTLEIHAINPNHDRFIRCFENIPIISETCHEYLFHYDKDNIKESFIKGGFNTGEGNSSNFITYASPISTTVKLPIETAIIPMIIFYDLAIVPVTFNAKRNNLIISNLFHKNPGGWEVVNINLENGKNIIDMSVGGIWEDSIKIHSDKFVIEADMAR